MKGSRPGLRPRWRMGIEVDLAGVSGDLPAELVNGNCKASCLLLSKDLALLGQILEVTVLSVVACLSSGQRAW